jgi:predicted transcriptional regulator
MKNLKQLRRDAALTQYGLAKATGIPRAKICHAELGIVALSSGEIALIRKILLKVARKNSARVLRELEPGANQQ